MIAAHLLGYLAHSAPIAFTAQFAAVVLQLLPALHKAVGALEGIGADFGFKLQ